MSPLPRRQFRDTILASLLALSSLCLAGCPGNLDPSLLGPPGPDVCDGKALMVMRCTQAACHGVGVKASGLDLFSDGVVGRLLGKKSDPATSTSCGTDPRSYLEANSSPATGMLLDKLTDLPGCGAQMPYLLTALTSTEMECIAEWSTAVTTGAITN